MHHASRITKYRMRACEGQPGKACLNRTKKKEILNCNGDLLLCEVCEYARFGEKNSRKPKKSTKERKKVHRSPQKLKMKTPQEILRPNSPMMVRNLVRRLEWGKTCSMHLSASSVPVHPLMISSFSATDVTLGFVFHVLR